MASVMPKLARIYRDSAIPPPGKSTVEWYFNLNKGAYSYTDKGETTTTPVEAFLKPAFDNKPPENVEDLREGEQSARAAGKELKQFLKVYNELNKLLSTTQYKLQLDAKEIMVALECID